MDQVENSDAAVTQPPIKSNQSLGFLNQSDERLLEIINSPLPVTNQNDGLALKRDGQSLRMTEFHLFLINFSPEKL